MDEGIGAALNPAMFERALVAWLLLRQDDEAVNGTPLDA